MSKTITKQPHTIRDLLAANQNKIKAALPATITPEKLCRVALSEISRNQQLQTCTGVSLFKSILISAQLGLFPDSLLGEAYLVPFKNNKNRTSDAQLIIGYKGLMKLAYQTNQFSNIYAKEICENDDYYYSFGLKPELKHIPAANNRGKIIYYYAVANFVNGGGAFEVMSVEDIKEHMKKYSKAFSAVSSPWQTNFDAMAMKTVIRKLVKFLPRSTDNLMQAVKHDEHAEICTQADFIDVDFDTVDEPVEPKKKKSDEVAEKLNNTSIPTEPSAEPEKPEPLSKENQAFVDEMGGVDNV